MPIYAYRCEECGFAKDVLQKMSDEPLSICLECGKPSFKKQVTAAGFQLKGSGWYVTDFRDGKGGASKPAAGHGDGVSASVESGPASSEPAASTSAAAAAPATPAASATPASSDTKVA